MNRPYREWIKRHYCEFCGKCDEIDNRGEPLVTPSHVRTYKATGVDLGNIIPLCVKCHQQFEGLPTEEKMRWEKVAKRYEHEYGYGKS